MGTASANTDTVISHLRPRASDSMPMKGEISATASTVIPTALPISTTVAFRSRCSSGRIDCTEYTWMKANTPTSATVSNRGMVRR